MKHKILPLVASAITTISFNAQAQLHLLQKNTPGSFPVAGPARAASIYTDKNDDWLVQKTAELLQQDITTVTGKKPEIIHNPTPTGIVIGTLDGSPSINRLIKENHLDVSGIKGKWEAFAIQVLNNKLFIIGSDKRGAAYGVFELSRQMGVSPWYWWADVPAKKKSEVYIGPEPYRSTGPSVKYRGIFLNDEAPALSGWTKEKFGGFNHSMYEHVFELLLRLKANYLWPAMWGSAFNDDDTLNPVLANKWGIVMGTYHHEPMLRAQQEWKRYGHGPWNYDDNKATLQAFWKKGIENMDHHESIVTIGMRGDGDMPMTEGANIQLLENIVADQRKILETVTGKPANKTPQLWALYKEVQDYYDKGMRVPDDVTLLLCDDNWGNIRRLPPIDTKPRSGGYGIYYHFDYVGDPRNYKWINTNNIARVWEQMHLAYSHKVKDIWIVNVGDLKPMELPISFFLDYAWNVGEWNENNLDQYYTAWAATQFGPAYASGIGRILRTYAQYASRRKPELLDANTYSLQDYNELNRITNDWNRLVTRAETINEALPAEYKDTYFELVLHPVKAFANLQNLYTAVAKHNAAKAWEYYAEDSLISLEYNQLGNGKWNHMMDQTHIGYTYWQQPEHQKMPAIPDGPADTTQAIDNTTLVFPASHYSRKKETNGIEWHIIPNIGRDGDGITTFPVTATPAANPPSLDYDFDATDTGNLNVNLYFSPTLNFSGESKGLQYAVSIDNDQPQTVSIDKDDHNQKEWSNWVANNIIITTTRHPITAKGPHTLHYTMISPSIILQKLVLDFGGMKPSYLGPSIAKAGNNAPQNTSSLKEVFKNDFLIGTAMDATQIEQKDPEADQLIKQQFNAVTPENIMKAEVIEPRWNTFNFDLADKLVAYGQHNGIRINAHNLIWHSQLPSFMETMKSADSVREYFQHHITTLASRYDGKVYSWDVVNEALNEDGTLRNSIFLQKLGPGYLVEAFRLTQKAAPHTKLYYNDYNIEQPAKRAGAIALIKKIQAAGVRIDGVGIQGHWNARNVPLKEIEESIKAFSALGIEVMFTELDLSVLPNPKNGNTADVNAIARGSAAMNPYPDNLPDSIAAIQSDAYVSLFRLFLKYRRNISRVTFWGVNDSQSWLNDWPILGRTNYPLLFDRDFQPKLVYFNVIATKTSL